MIRSVIVLLILGILSCAAYAIFHAGINYEKMQASKAIGKEVDSQKEKAEEIIKWKVKEKVIYRDRIKTIKAATDPSGCLDSDLRDVGLGRMLRSDSD